ncbi:MAG: glycerophosphodiester phosphodiesterase family protein [Armatimonadota bacterium]|nr:glycerophosphodiester phosphodiesterase family protein [Armatimonadota bacterium]MDR7402311.1 glycerophosphodiester phosphodiesterase family protein [Armatimonadota bacterium]MDR7404382.1 glycerophosphodiester phosphodiesterase family protein [Armatimonadota bacterium]MDR7437296.1 glycerophosphodiester phosphodiesterase family protein [Armatimonadota bacterium]MDR7472635.1 glycerophosphodiester phosphodiesterase family protein [Armatimonadota bacterium]
MTLPGGLFWRGRRVLLKYHKLLSGTGRHPPNSLSALREVLDGGAEVIEFDIQPLADGDYAVLHDERLESETTGWGPVRACARADLKTLRLRGSDEPPATLSDVVEVLAAVRRPVKVQVDCKEWRPWSEERARHLLGALEPLRRVPALRVVVGCLGDWNLRLLHRLDPTVAVGLDWMFYLDGPADEHARLPTRVNAYGYLDDHPLGFRRILPPAAYLADRVDSLCRLVEGAQEVYLRKEFLLQALADGFNPVPFLRQRLGRPVVVDVWTLNEGPDSQNDLRAVLEAGVDQVTTDTAVQLAARVPP